MSKTGTPTTSGRTPSRGERRASGGAGKTVQIGRGSFHARMNENAAGGGSGASSFRQGSNKLADAISEVALAFHLKQKEDEFNRHVEAIRAQYQSIESIIGNPICCSYLLKFCRSEYNAENLEFLLEVDEFRDTFAVDIDVWLDTWKEVDERVDFDSDEIDEDLMNEEWPSLNDRDATFSRINDIMTKFIEDDAPNQVCISEQWIKKTKRRIELFHLYGPEVFEEACLDPIKTLHKDVRPRFVRSQIYEAMIRLIASCEPPPPGRDLKVPPPDNYAFFADVPITAFTDTRKYTLDEVLVCGPMYEVFLEFLGKSVSAENLKCVRMVTIFDALAPDKTGGGSSSSSTREGGGGSANHLGKAAADVEKELSDAAWDIYRFFVAPGAAFEVSVHHLTRKRIMQQLATPVPGMFDTVRKSAYEMLAAQFAEFKKSLGYDHLPAIARKAKQAQLDDQKRRKNSFTLPSITAKGHGPSSSSAASSGGRDTPSTTPGSSEGGPPPGCFAAPVGCFAFR